MGTPSASFAVELKDETSGPAKDAAASLVNLKDKIDSDVKALREMRKAMRNLKGGTSTNVAAFRELRDKITAQKASIAESQSKFVELGGTFAKVNAATGKAGGGFDALANSAAGTSGPIGKLGGLMSRLSSVMSSPITIALALAAAFIAIGAAVGVAAAALLKFGVVQSDARRLEALQIEGLNTLKLRYMRTTASVEAMQAAMDRAEDSTGVSRSTLQKFTRQMSRAGLRAGALADAVEAMGIASVVQGDRGVARFRALAINARLTGGSVKDLAKSYKDRLGPIADKVMLGLGSQMTRFKRNIGRLFDGLDTEPFLKALDGILDLFSQTTATGRALKSIINALLQPLIKDSGKTGSAVKRMFQGMVIIALKATIAFLKVRLAIKNIGKAAANLSSQGGIIGLGAGFVDRLINGVDRKQTKFEAAMQRLNQSAAVSAQDPAPPAAFEEMGGGIIDGLVRGIKNGASRVSDAIGEVASGASQTFQDTLEISSPSRVFTRFGSDIAEGTAQGIDAGSASVNESIGGLVDEPESGGALGGGATSISIGDVNIDAGESADPRELAVMFRDELASILEGMSVELGAT